MSLNFLINMFYYEQCDLMIINLSVTYFLSRFFIYMNIFLILLFFYHYFLLAFLIIVLRCLLLKFE